MGDPIKTTGFRTIKMTVMSDDELIDSQMGQIRELRDEIERMQDAAKSQDAEWQKALGIPIADYSGSMTPHDIECVVGVLRRAAERGGDG